MQIFILNVTGQLPFHGQFHFVDDSDFGRFTRQYYLNIVFENVPTWILLNVLFKVVMP